MEYIDTQESIEREDMFFMNMWDFLVDRDINYGSLVFNPIGVFANNSPEEGMRIRMDNKLKRIKHMTDNEEEPRKDDVIDLIGYLFNYCIKRDGLIKKKINRWE